jgi:hypothetical protein
VTNKKKIPVLVQIKEIYIIVKVYCITKSRFSFCNAEFICLSAICIRGGLPMLISRAQTLHDCRLQKTTNSVSLPLVDVFTAHPVFSLHAEPFVFFSSTSLSLKNLYFLLLLFSFSFCSFLMFRSFLVPPEI